MLTDCPGYVCPAPMHFVSSVVCILVGDVKESCVDCVRWVVFVVPSGWCVLCPGIHVVSCSLDVVLFDVLFQLCYLCIS